MSTPLGLERETLRGHGARLRPLRNCLRASLSDAGWLYEDDMENDVLELELQKIDKNFEVVYDRCTSANDQEPSHHLYRVLSYGGGPMDDRLVLEMSLQYDMTKAWPEGRPRAPGRWLIQAIKERLKDHLGSDDESVHKAMVAKADAEHVAAVKEADRKIANSEAVGAMKDMKAKALRGKRSGVRYRKPREKGKTTRIIVPGSPEFKAP